MNKIEQMFFDAWNDYLEETEGDENATPYCEFELEKQVTIGIYRVDFCIGSCIIEIDGQETHKTKAQRCEDYERERFLQKKGYTVIRFMASEVFVNAKQCVLDSLTISNRVEEKERNAWLWSQGK